MAPRWVLQPVPVPLPKWKTSVLTGVSCSSASRCMAVGWQASAGPLAESWNGTAWTILPTPIPATALEATFAGVSCSSASACTAVGQYLASGGATGSLVERWNGTEWSIQPNPTSGATTDQQDWERVLPVRHSSWTPRGHDLTGPLARMERQYTVDPAHAAYTPGSR